ncbi:MAG: glycosyltransferase family 2 protein [Thermoplasmata archaeon]
MISAVVPAYNEGKRIERVLEELSDFVDEIIVIDDASQDDTSGIASRYARVIRNKKNLGYIGSIKRGFNEAKGDIVVTLDADGEHDPRYIPAMVSPIQNRKADLVFGKRDQVPRVSERVVSYMVRRRVGAKDTGTGFRAIRSGLAKRLELKGRCTCGIFALEAKSKGAEIKEIRAPTRDIDKPRGIAWDHFYQFFTVLKFLIKKRY